MEIAIAAYFDGRDTAVDKVFTGPNAVERANEYVASHEYASHMGVMIPYGVDDSGLPFGDFDHDHQQ